MYLYGPFVGLCDEGAIPWITRV